jgi:CheY-like chemotaxis protein
MGVTTKALLGQVERVKRTRVVIDSLSEVRLSAKSPLRYRPWGRSVAVITLTGWGQEGDRAQSSTAGCAGHLVKPVSLVELRRTLASVEKNGHPTAKACRS